MKVSEGPRWPISRSFNAMAELIGSSKARLVALIIEVLRIFFTMIVLNRKLSTIELKWLVDDTHSAMKLIRLLLLPLECDRVRRVAAEDVL